MKRWTQFLLLFCTLFFYCQAQTTAQLLQEAESYYQDDDYSKAIPLYEKYLLVNEKDHEALQSAGISYFRLNNYQKAKDKFRLAALYCPADEKSSLASYYTNLSGAYSNLNDNEKAYEYATKAYRIDETSSTLFNAVSMANNINRCPDALKLLKDSKVEKDNNFNALYGICYYKENEYDKSIKHYEDFFANYDAERSINFIMEDEKQRLFNAYLSAAAIANAPISNERISKIKNLYLDLLKNEDKKEQILNRFTLGASTWNLNRTSAEIINQLVNISAKQIPVKTQLEIKMAQQDFGTMYEMADNYLKQNPKLSSDDLYMVKFYRYIGSLYDFTGNLRKNNFEPDEKKLTSLIAKFKAIYPKKEYAKEELTPELMLTVKTTLEFFKDATKSKEEERKVVPLIQKILINFPNVEVRNSIAEFLSKGTLDN